MKAIFSVIQFSGAMEKDHFHMDKSTLSNTANKLLIENFDSGLKQLMRCRIIR